MATIKAIEAGSIHQIQSGQVIVDLCSVVKELVENSLDAGSSSVEVRFKNNGLESIEVQDNGSGIAPANYESVALKHHTSKLSNYDDLSSLETFGFRGEALSSLCALSSFHIVTAQADEAPRGRRLDFEISGKLKSATVVACQRGTTASVEGLFEQLPVRRKELAKNIKREYGKVLGLLHAYACISVNVKFTVKNSMPKGKSVTVFATNSNATTKENIANVYGAKTLSALVPLDLNIELQPSATQKGGSGDDLSKIFVHGHISRPVYGEGRQTPDRQMFFVNSRPCGTPQIAKAFNEVYKSFNASQSPFIFADFRMDTNAYDVNVSPDKRIILLHDSAALIEKLKTSLADLFEKQDQTMPQSQLQTPRFPAFKQLNINREIPTDSTTSAKSNLRSEDSPSLRHGSTSIDEDSPVDEPENSRRLHDFFQNQTSTRDESKDVKAPKTSRGKIKLAKAFAEEAKVTEGIDDYENLREMREVTREPTGGHDNSVHGSHVRDFNERMAEQQKKAFHNDEVSLPVQNDQTQSGFTANAVHTEQPNIVQNAFDRMRPKRTSAEMATITVGDKTITTMIGDQVHNRVDGPSKRAKKAKSKTQLSSATHRFSQSLRNFTAPGTQAADSASEDDTKDKISGELQTEEDDVPSVHEEDSSSSRLEEDDKSSDSDGEPSLRQKRSESPHSDEDYVDEEGKKAREEKKVAELIRAAEERAAIPTVDSIKRANRVLKSSSQKESIANLMLTVDGTIRNIERQLEIWQNRMAKYDDQKRKSENDNEILAETEEERLSLTVMKDDFSRMQISGQFNLGFILAVRPSSRSPAPDTSRSTSDELFIIDQHASDEKFNFERLQAETVVGNQRLVRPLPLGLTAVEEEIMIENTIALEKNGFIVEIDTSGERPIGQRCRLVSFPLSKEVVFDTRDLDELIHLLAESPTLNAGSAVPRPSKVRKMFAMRACRSSIMIGKPLSFRQMSTVVRHMGTIEKPWNCPHGRPTMRHLMSLNAFDTWQEGDEFTGLDSTGSTEAEIWSRYGR